MGLARKLRDWWWAPVAATAAQNAAVQQQMLFEVLRVSQAQAEVAGALARVTEQLLLQREELPLPQRRSSADAEWLIEMGES